MSCAHPFTIKTKKWNYSTGEFWSYVPCGYCLNCRVDKQNQLTHRCEEELINYKCGAFVTLTYDDFHITDKLRNDKNGKLVATLSRDDLKHYMYRLRSNIKNRLPDTLLSNHHFKFLAVGEYGGDGQIFDRPHIHLLFFGLDFALCKKEIEKAWQGRGMVKCLPILNGGIRYVLKYLDKQLFGDQAAKKYDENNIERPFQVHSLGLGSSLYKKQLDHINKNGTYRWKGHEVPVPPYYKNKYFTKSNQFINYKKQIENYKLYNDYKKPGDRYDLHNFNIQQALIKEKNLNQQNRYHGRPIYDYNYINNLKYRYNDIKLLADLCEVPF